MTVHSRRHRRRLWSILAAPGTVALAAITLLPVTAGAAPSGSGGQWHVDPGSTATVTVTTATSNSNTASITISG